MKQPVEQRFWSKVQRGQPDECREWLGARTDGGYGNFAIWPRNIGAHRMAYELSVGPIPAGLQIDHLCRNRGCVNPAHLEAVTGRVNVLRADTFVARQAAQTHCLRGHEFTPENTRVNGRHRSCKTCARDQKRAVSA